MFSKEYLDQIRAIADTITVKESNVLFAYEVRQYRLFLEGETDENNT